MTLFVIILNWESAKETIQCIHSLNKSSFSDFIPLVVDNHSRDNSVQEIKSQFPHIEILETEKNQGYAGGNNVGMQAAFSKGADAVLILNNDTEVTEDFLENILKLAKESPSPCLIGGCPVLYSNPSILDHLGGIWNSEKACFDLVGYRAPLSSLSSFASLSLDYVCGCALYIDKEIFKKLGLFEERYFLFWEEADYCAKAKKKGIEIKVCMHAIVKHKVSHSFTGYSALKTYFWWRNRFFWIKRNQPYLYYYKMLWKKGLSHLVKSWKRYIIRSFFFYLRSPFLQKEEKSIQKQKILLSLAEVRGIADFLFKQMGDAPQKFKNKTPC